jgi:hypothetical protein
MLVLAIGLSASIAYAGGGTAFTYQGRLLDAGEPANGLFDLEFSLWDAANGGGSQIGITQVLNNTPVTDGLFTVQIDFGADAFDNGDRWLEVSVDGVPLDPRQPITRTPYSIQTRGIIVNDDQHVGMGVSPGSARLRAWNFAGNGFEVLSSSRAVEAISTGDMAILASNQSADGMGVFAQHQPSGNQGWLGTPDYGVYGKALDIANDWAGYFLGNGYFSGFVGIGTSEPEAPLHVVSADFRTIYAVNTATSGIHYGLYGQSNSTAGTGLYGFATATSGLTYGVLGANSSTGGRGVLGSAAAASGVNSGVYGLTNSPAGYGVYSQGNYGGTGAKYFIQPHPYDPSKEIRFVCLEGNESGTYFRGSTQLVDGRAHIHVPEEFRLVSETEGLTVQVTPRGPATLWVESVDLDRIVVAGNVDAVYFDYFVNGIRRGFAHMELIRENHGYVPEVRGVPFGTQYRPAHRQILVDNGILNPDFTPNKATAAMMGWTLRDPEPEDQLTEESKSQSGGTK